MSTIGCKKGDQQTIKGEHAECVADVEVSLGNGKRMVVQMWKLTHSGMFFVLRNTFLQGTFGPNHLDAAKKLYLETIEEASF